MDDMITRIVEIEKQCADEIEKAEQAYRKKIEIHRAAVQERKAKECARIVSESETRLAQAIEEAKKKTEAEFQAAGGDIEKLYQDTSLDREIQEKIVSILLTI
ncbi:MAG: hypothetical protein E4H15_00945 [Syntrophobacterales bacterium]|nr:MAG: hypothetical protein E4H15_00945 [Syntrophobacterales bacterium]